MQGRITSREQSRNAHGVLYSELLAEAKANHVRLVAALTNALTAWQELDALESGPGTKASKRTKVAALRELAREMTERALL